jgi:uncharacterized protein (DUF362 family)/NAD-dependent dihydropyrimidine dehydrogenase PreA subunit
MKPGDDNQRRAEAPTVAVVRCAAYGADEVESAVAEALRLVGGIGSYVKKGDRVLLKPNLLSPSAPDKAITTHPQVLKAVIRQVQSAGGIPIVADSLGGPLNRKLLEIAYDKSGWKAVCDETGARLNYDTGSRQVPYPDGRLIKRLDLMDVLFEADVVITLPKLKTHMLTHMTGATKILFGTVPGLTKPAYHLKFPEPSMFCDMLLDILCYVKPSLSIMDGVVGIEGDGPGAHGTPKSSKVILASADSAALDVVAANIMGLDPHETIILKKAIERGLTSGDLSDITVVGEKVDDVRCPFKPATGSRGIITRLMSSGALRAVMLRVAVPYPEASKDCVRCGVCALNCPANAITITDRARMDLKKCIRCYCCHELCPHKAITLKTPIDVLRRRGRGIHASC